MWTGAKNTKGYGNVGIEGKVRSVHRVAYEEIMGPIPAGLELDHLCRNRACYNPEHLEPVTHTENMRRGRVFDYQRNKTHCPQGHLYSGSNLIVQYQKKGYINRVCRTCHRATDRASKARRKANADA